MVPIDGPPTNVEFDEAAGVDNRNWILFDSRVRVLDAEQWPPVVLDVDIEPFAGIDDETVVAVRFSEDVGSLEAADVALTPLSGPAAEPVNVSYDPATFIAVVTYAEIGESTFVFSVFDDAVSANGKQLDGEVDDSAWWDDTLFPSGDGQPGGDTHVQFTRRRGDYTRDGRVDLDDFPAFPACMTGPDGGPYEPGCGAFDFNADGDVDLNDFRGFASAMDA